jgi:gliding motility associated protien GldN
MHTLQTLRKVFSRTLPCGLLLAAHLASAQPLDSETAPPVPLNDIVERRVITEKRTLDYPPLRESDILWENRLWRVVDVREKMNQPFANPEAPLFDLMRQAANAGDLPLYTSENFTERIHQDDLKALLSKTDTIITIDPVTYVEKRVVVHNELNWEDVKRFRIREAWYFDSRTSQLRVRILGICPMYTVRDNEGNFKYELPLFWVHYPSARPLLAQWQARTHGGNWSATTTWEDVFEMRYFASYITKENNLYDRRLEDYLSGPDLLFASETIKQELFNREHDLWQQ